MSTPVDFIHEFVPGRADRTLLLIDGTGGHESNLLAEKTS